MIVFPAVDLKGGKCVRLERGVMASATVYAEDPAATAKRWQDEGAEWLHVVDLDGAMAGEPRNHGAVARILRAVSIPVQVGGGVRTAETLATYLESGVQRVVLGTAALKDPRFLAQTCERFPGRVVLGIDSRHGRVAVEGWDQTSEVGPVELARKFEMLALAAIVYTDIQRDGMQTGPNIEATRELARGVRLPVIASGGVGRLEDVAALRTLEPEGVVGVIVGRALYTGSIKLAEAIVLGRGGHIGR
ncbi:MAG TPA: 1-(5-phosphoribosyl)-5-[(5-phosphoribosylamino)methylideneamino]imidazole-4-carboxamide isomerase [Syntrophobacteria bacterium]|nr:1-(5-phosphoribosyl)-5-[(5-phosphoribosylamino)methylideneamino]imidazole-4-carboxamide isomerase [Syntrophobacteria bacterium]